MTRQLSDAVAEAQQLPETDQADLAEVVRAFIAARKADPIALTPDEEAAIDEGLAQADHGEFVPDEEMEAFFKSHGV